MRWSYPLFTLALALTIISCTDTPVDPPNHDNDNLIINGNFRTAINGWSDIITGNEAAPWKSAYGSPQIVAGPGGDNTSGYLQLWGNETLGECTYQHLIAPIRKGHTYTLTAYARFMNDNPKNYTPNVRVRFIAFNERVNTNNLHWADHHPNVSVIGSLTTDDTSWRKFDVGQWTADADYRNFAINVENDTPDDGTPYTVSWAKVDKVVLQELNIPN